ncbi:uncharacterized mitochondrial protein AtMg00300-like [Henckelia pumila]|uniref:uncharacterized mitochondrial protein AtMg00300-like n=1 Tax=Henckelia pumila TaxID=405737 RepID=UPI003C6E649E
MAEVKSALLSKELQRKNETKEEVNGQGLMTRDSTGYRVGIENGIMKVKKRSLIEMKGIKQNGLYLLERKTIDGSANTILKAKDNILLWHKRLGHLSERGLIQLNKQSLLGKDVNGKLGFCEECTLGKYWRVKFKPSNRKIKGVLDYIRGGIWSRPVP